MSSPKYSLLHSLAFCAQIVLLFSACTSPDPDVLVPLPTVTSVSGQADAPSDWYHVYFTDPKSPTADTYRGGPDEALAAAIDQARSSVDVAIYDLNLWSLRDALVAAHERGVTVRVVTESDNMDEVEIQDLIEAGIPVLGDRRESLMHNKFVVIDRVDVWVGSMNFTINGAYNNNNNLIRIRSSRLAENYITEFEEMFVSDFFGTHDIDNTPHPTLSVEATLIETYFSPDDGTAARLVDLIESAEETVHFMVYSFTSDDIADAMLVAAQNGVTVAGVFEMSQYRSNRGTEFDNLLNAGLDVRLDGNSRNMHHKVIIIDGTIVITGSYNFSASAEERNDENTIILHNPEIAAAYEAEFRSVFEDAQH